MGSRRPTTRRELLQRGGILAGALWVGRWSGASPSSASTAGGGRLALAAERRRVYAALADTFVAGPAMRLPAAAGERVTADFERAYVTWPAADRSRADAVLDALGREFTARGRAEREATMRGERSGPALAYRARALVAVALAGSDELSRAEAPL